MTPSKHQDGAVPGSLDQHKPRQYLRAGDRRRQLLEVAATMARREGLDRLSMIGLASEAGVSRQLVYEHFPSLSSLVASLLLDRFGELDADVAAAIAESRAKGHHGALDAARLVLARPAEERQILRAMLLYSGSPDHELHELATKLRTRTIDRWSGMLPIGDKPASQGLVWALVNALFGLGDLVAAGEITVDQALELLATLINAGETRLT